MLYGIAVFIFMHFVDYYRSRPPGAPKFTTQSLVIAVLTHMFCVGLPNRPWPPISFR